MDEKLMEKYLKKYGLKIKNSFSHRKAISKEESPKLNTAARKTALEKVKNWKIPKKKKIENSGELLPENWGKKAVTTDSFTRLENEHFTVKNFLEIRNKSKENREEEMMNKSHLPPYKQPGMEIINRWSYSKKFRRNIQNKIFKTRKNGNYGKTRSVKGSYENGKKKFLKVNSPLYGVLQDKRVPVTEEIPAENNFVSGKFYKKRQKRDFRNNFDLTVDYIRDCAVINTSAETFSENGNNNSCSNSNNFVMDIVKSENVVGKGLLQDDSFKKVTIPEVSQVDDFKTFENRVKLAVQDTSVISNSCEKEDYDSRKSEGEDDKETVIFDDSEFDDREKSFEETFDSIPGIAIKQSVRDVVKRKKRNFVKVKMKRNVWKMASKKVKEGISNSRSKENWEIKSHCGQGHVEHSKKAEQKIFKKVMGEICGLVKHIHEMNRIILRLKKDMPQNAELAHNFQTVITTQQENLKKEISDNREVILRKYNKLLSVSNNPSNVVKDISNRTCISASDVLYVISCCSVENTDYQKLEVVSSVKKRKRPENLQNSKAQITATPGDGKFVGTVGSSVFEVDYSESLKKIQSMLNGITERACSEKPPKDSTSGVTKKQRTDNSNKLQTNYSTGQDPKASDLKYPFFLFGNPATSRDSVQRVTKEMIAKNSATMERSSYPQPSQVYPTNKNSLSFNNTQRPQECQQQRHFQPRDEYDWHCRSQNVSRFFMETQGIQIPKDSCVTNSAVQSLTSPSVIGRNFEVPLRTSAVSVQNFRQPNNCTFSSYSTDCSVNNLNQNSSGYIQPPKLGSFLVPRSSVSPSQALTFASPQRGGGHSSSFNENIPNQLPPRYSSIMKVSNLPPMPSSSMSQHSPMTASATGGQAVPPTQIHCRSNRLQVLDKPVSNDVLPPKKNSNYRVAVTEETTVENVFPYSLRDILPSRQPLVTQGFTNGLGTNPRGNGIEVSSNIDLNIRTGSKPDKTSADATDEILDPTVPQKLTMRNQRLQAGTILTSYTERETSLIEDSRHCEEAEKKKDSYNSVANKNSDMKNQSSRYICAREGCKSPGLRICKGCQSVIYCSNICQLNHWIVKHKEECHKLKELRG